MTFNQILDDYAKRGLLDGNLVARLSAAHKREVADALDTGAFVEAAYEREKATAEKPSVVANAAKMREALIELTDKVLHYLQNELILLPLPIEEANAKARAALSAPPRNCDLPTVISDTHRAWLDDKDNWDEFGDPRLEIHEWLISPAKKGDNDGSK